jgi:protein-disulfide isomerase
MTKTRSVFAAVALAAAVGLTLAWAFAPADLDAQAPLLPVRGDVSGPIVIMVFSDFQDPGSAEVEPVLKTVRAEFPKDVQVIFKHRPAPERPQAALAHEAAVEAGRQGRFWEMHDRLFANQKGLGREDLIKHASALGLDVAAFTRALDARTHRASVERDLAEARAVGVTGTPAIFINGRRATGMPPVASITKLIRSLLSGGDGTEPEPVPTSTFDLTGSPVRGPADAPVTIVAFSDLQCSFCARANATVERVLAQYPGRVRWVFKHFPLENHAEAPLAHRAALAANEQGRFWEMHDAIFAKQRTMKREDLLAHAATLKLDIARFTADLDSDKYSAVIARDMKEGASVGVEGTPTFFINGAPVVGAQPFEKFTAVINKALAAPAAAPVARAGSPQP